MERLTIDSNIFIYAEVAEFPEHNVAVKKLNELRKNNLFIVNTTIISEIHYKLGKLLGWREAESRTSNILNSSSVVYEPLFADTLHRAFRISRRHSLKTNDAIIAQHTLDLGVKRIFTDNVRDLQKVEELELTVLRSSDFNLNGV